MCSLARHYLEYHHRCSFFFGTLQHSCITITVRIPPIWPEICQIEIPLGHVALSVIFSCRCLIRTSSMVGQFGKARSSALRLSKSKLSVSNKLPKDCLETQFDEPHGNMWKNLARAAAKKQYISLVSSEDVLNCAFRHKLPVNLVIYQLSAIVASTWTCQCLLVYRTCPPRVQSQTPIVTTY